MTPKRKRFLQFLEGQGRTAAEVSHFPGSQLLMHHADKSAQITWEEENGVVYLRLTDRGRRCLHEGRNNA